MDPTETSLEVKFDQLADQVQRVSLGLGQQGELLYSISTPPQKKGRASIGTPKCSPKKKEPHSLELLKTDGIDYLKQAGHTHMGVIMGRANACSPLPPPPTNAEISKVTTTVPMVSAYPSEPVSSTPSNYQLADHGVISQNFADYIRSCLSLAGLSRFTFDWDGWFQDHFNRFALQFFIRTFKQALTAGEYGVTLHQSVEDLDLKLTAFFYVHTKTLKAQYKASLKNPDILDVRKDVGRVRKAKQDRCGEYKGYLSAIQVDSRLIAICDDHNVMGEEVSIHDGAVTHRQVLIPSWWWASLLQFMGGLERRVQISVLAEKKKGSTRTLRQFVAPPNSTMETTNVPKELPEDCYHKANFLDCLRPVQLKAWKLQPLIMPEDVKDLFNPSSSRRTKSAPSSVLGSGPNSQNARPTTSNPIDGSQEQSEFPAGMFENEEDEAMGDGEDEVL